MDKRLEQDVDATELQSLQSAAVSLKRIADALKGIDISLDLLFHLLKNKL